MTIKLSSFALALATQKGGFGDRDELLVSEFDFLRLIRSTSRFPVERVDLFSLFAAWPRL